jgi:hypothetical protein
LGLIDNCVELASVLDNRLILQRQLEQTRREKLLINLIIFASFRPNNQSIQEKLAMWQWIKSIFNPIEQTDWQNTTVLMTGVC